MLDTGASACFIPHEGIIMKQMRPKLLPSLQTVRAANNTILESCGMTHLATRTSSKAQAVETKAYLIKSGSLIASYDIILGMPQLRALGAMINFKADPIAGSWKDDLILAITQSITSV